MKFTSISRSLLCLAVCLISQQLTKAEPSPTSSGHLSQAQALQTASAFCRSIGVSVQAPADVVFPAKERIPDAPRYWQRRWQITFTNRVEVEVVDADSTVCSFFNPGLIDQLAREKTPAGDAISEAEAIKQATTILNAAGQIDELMTPVGHLDQDSSLPLMAAHNWRVTWKRAYHGVPYADQQAAVLLQAETGEPERFILMFPSAAPTSSLVNMDLQEAVNLASGLMDLSRMPDVVLDSIQTLVVQPNTFWQPGGDEEHKVPGPARVVRVVRFRAGDDTREVWIDTKTGQVIGGAASGLLGRSKSTQPAGGPLPVGKALHAAQEVRIYRANSKGPGWQTVPNLVLNAKSQPKFFSQLRAARGIAEGTPTSDSGEYKFVVYSKSRVISNYVDTGGYIGNTKQWVSVPPTIQSLLNKTPSASQAK